MLLRHIHIGSDKHLVVDVMVQRPVLDNQSELAHGNIDQSDNSTWKPSYILLSPRGKV